MTRFLFASLAVVALAFSACTDNQQPTAPAPTGLSKAVIETVDYTGVVLYNTCCDDYITLNGSLHFEMNVTTPPDGTVKIFGFNAQGFSGVGASGTTYRIQVNEMDKETWTANYDGTLTAKYRLRMVGTGPDGHECTFYFTGTENWSIVNDVWTLVSSTYETSCA